jgi:hypothetical protein
MVFSSGEVMLNLPPRGNRLHTGGAAYAPFAKDKKGTAMYSVGRVGFVQNGKYLITPSKTQVYKHFLSTTILNDFIT